MLALSVLLFFVSIYLANSDGLPPRTLGIYTLLADDSHANYTTNTSYQPELYPYQIQGFNVLFFTFINPQSMIVPKAFENLAYCRGERGCPRPDQLIIFSIGGQLYSETTWPWLEDSSLAIQMAQKVSHWFNKYNINGIDIDIEGNAGNDDNAASNLITFVNELKSLLNEQYGNDNDKNVIIRSSDNDNAPLSHNIITVPVYGYPQINAENNVVNNAFCENGGCYNMVDSIGIMVYEDTESLDWVKDYNEATSQYDGFPITCNVPSNQIIVGLQGTATSEIIDEITIDVMQQNLGGIMVWYGSVYDRTRHKPGLEYDDDADNATPMRNVTGTSWRTALNRLSK